MWCGHRKKDRQRDTPAQRTSVPRHQFRSAEERQRTGTYTAVVIALYWTVKLAGAIPWQAFGPWHR